MKKVFAMMMVCGLAVAFVACGGAKKEESTQDTTKQEMPAPAPDTTKTDTTKAAN